MSVKCITKALGTVAAVALLAGISTGPARAGSSFFTFASGDRSASALFVSSGADLTVTLTNTSTADVMDPTHLLTALFFTGGGTLTPVSATLNTGSQVYLGTTLVTVAAGNVGGEWGYAGGLSGAPGGATQGISTAGFGLFGDGNFNGPNLSKQNGLDGADYAITSAGDDPATGNGDVSGNPIINNSVVFVLTGLPNGFDASTGISNVWFTYATTLSPTDEFPPVPEPAFYQMAGFLSMGGLGLLKLRRRRK